MVYYDFSPQGNPGWFAETFGSVPGNWDRSYNVPDNATLMAEWETTSGQDAAVYDALYDAYQQSLQGNADPYSASYNNCYSVAERIIVEALSEEGSDQEQADDFTSYFTSSVSLPIGAFGVGGEGGTLAGGSNIGAGPLPGSFDGLGAGSGGYLGSFGAILGNLYLRHLAKGIYTSRYIYGEEKGLWGGINGKSFGGGKWPSWQSLHKNEVYWGKYFRQHGIPTGPSNTGSMGGLIPGSCRKLRLNSD